MLTIMHIHICVNLLGCTKAIERHWEQNTSSDEVGLYTWGVSVANR